MASIDHHEQAGYRGSEGTRQVEATVVAVIPEYHQAKLRADDGNTYAVTSRTKGVTFGALRKGQHLRLLVTLSHLPKVLSVLA